MLSLCNFFWGLLVFQSFVQGEPSVVTPSFTSQLINITDGASAIKSEEKEAVVSTQDNVLVTIDSELEPPSELGSLNTVILRKKKPLKQSASIKDTQNDGGFQKISAQSKHGSQKMVSTSLPMGESLPLENIGSINGSPSSAKFKALEHHGFEDTPSFISSTDQTNKRSGVIKDLDNSEDDKFKTFKSVNINEDSHKTLLPNSKSLRTKKTGGENKFFQGKQPLGSPTLQPVKVDEGIADDQEEQENSNVVNVNTEQSPRPLEDDVGLIKTSGSTGESKSISSIDVSAIPLNINSNNADESNRKKGKNVQEILTSKLRATVRPPSSPTTKPEETADEKGVQKDSAFVKVNTERNPRPHEGNVDLGKTSGRTGELRGVFSVEDVSASSLNTNNVNAAESNRKTGENVNMDSQKSEALQMFPKNLPNLTSSEVNSEKPGSIVTKEVMIGSALGGSAIVSGVGAYCFYLHRRKKKLVEIKAVKATLHASPPDECL
jgi:hypothetical protein